MKPLSLVMSILITFSGCAVIANSGSPRYNSTGRLVENSCRQSNGASGVDLVGGIVFGVLTAVASQEDPNVALGGSVVTIMYAGSTVYGFVRSDTCRHLHRESQYTHKGGRDWEKGVLYSVLGIASLGVLAVASQYRGSSGKAPTIHGPDICELGETPVAICRDGLYSCSKSRQGTCSNHDGVAKWLD